MQASAYVDCMGDASFIAAEYNDFDGGQALTAKNSEGVGFTTLSLSRDRRCLLAANGTETFFFQYADDSWAWNKREMSGALITQAPDASGVAWAEGAMVWYLQLSDCAPNPEPGLIDEPRLIDERSAPVTELRFLGPSAPY